MAAGLDRGTHSVGEPRDIAGVEIVDHLRKHDQVETARRPFGPHADILQRDVWKCPASKGSHLALL
jgi:hypothetical protein